MSRWPRRRSASYRRRAGAIVLTLAVAAVGLAEDPERALDPQGRAMLDPIRTQALHPEELVTRLHLAPDATVADVGAGPGFLTLYLARAVPKGQVIAADIRDDYLAVTAARAARAGLSNV